ncbi:MULTISPECIES: TRAM domain-containing protein [unclassified Nocardioides]|uniref:class I SAM-dependent RNA methyltransferase n=1 Tax=unclassified Nocardioides TaxID=2615069 RepID=UPI000056F72B|nr:MULTISPECIES: TRAM domain-containing protein [unclassified Nocardioides]ABL82403.1 23S rRNA m(5)U-1939 methyltransferase [Nocardioides sp. JS614]
MTRQPRPRRARGGSRVGERFEAVVGPIAHGGHCIVRLDGTADGPSDRPRVVFVRHAIPGERVVVEITEGTEGDRFWRGDAVEVLEASRDRVEPPCPYAGPGRCGGCDFQHVALPRQRELKAAVVREQLGRLARAEVHVEVEPLPADSPEMEGGLRWRTRIQWAIGPRGQRGLRKYRSREVVSIDDCLITRPDARAISRAGTTLDRHATALSTVVGERVDVPRHGGEHVFAVEADGFWQVHPGAPRILVETVLDLLQPRRGETALDLYSGVGLFARYLAEAVGPTGRVLSVEGDRTASRHARANLAGLEGVDVECGAVDRVLADPLPPAYSSVDLVVLDPPREGARALVVEQVVERSPRAVAYVACDPAALARDVATFQKFGYHLRSLRALDMFPMTSHVEVVAQLVKSGSGLR